MKKLFLLLLLLCQPVFAEDTVKVIDVIPREFAQAFNRTAPKQFARIKLKNIYAEQKVALAPNISLNVASHTDAIEFVDVLCNRITAKGVAEKCVAAILVTAKALDPQFDQLEFSEFVGRTLERGVSVAYRQNGIEYHVIPDQAKKQLRTEIQIFD